MFRIPDKDRIELDRKFYGIFLFGFICALLLIFGVTISINTSSGIRAYVAGEGYWAKAQKEAVFHLTSYLITEDSTDHDNFRRVLRVNRGDRVAREELLKDEYNYQSVYDGFLMGLNHPEDIPDMINVFRRFQHTPQIKHAIDVWTVADKKIQELVSLADSIKSDVQDNELTSAEKEAWLSRIEDLDHQLTALELEFSNAMGNMARTVNTIFRWSTIILGLLVIAIGLWITLRFYRSTGQWMNALKESEERFKNVLDNSKDVLYKMDLETRKYVFVSPALESMLGYDENEFKEGGVQFILDHMHPDDVERMGKVVENYDHLEDGDFLPSVEFRLKDSDGNWKWVSNVRTLVKNKNGEPEAIVGAVRDISTRKEQEQKIKESLEEKEILLKEIHHRVKNNLAIVSSLLELQKTGTSEEVQQILKSSQNRIKSIAKVHEKLYESTTFSDVPLDNYISELTEEIKLAYKSDEKDIQIEMNLAPVKININDAIPIGLILNELINNAFKHSFVDKDSGTLKVILREKEQNFELLVQSDGNKMDDDFDQEESSSLGMTLIEVLVKRIEGTLEIEQNKWTTFKITFDLD